MVLASDVVSLPGIAEQLGAALGVGTFGGQVFMGLIFMAIFLFPTIFLCSKRNVDLTFPILIVGFATLCAAIPLFGFPSWIVIVMFLLIGAMWGGKVRSWISGTGGGE